MTLEPLYAPDDVTAAYQLRYHWTGWPSNVPFPARPADTFFGPLREAWEGDGIRVLDLHWRDHELNILTSVTPRVSPVFFTARMKGRLQHALRQAKTPVKFSRKVGMNTVGEARRVTIERYVARQVARANFADPDFEAFLQQFTVIREGVDLSEPVATNSGRYWYNLHLVLVVRDRLRITDEARLTTLRDTSLRIAEVKGHRIAALAMMPDHLHIALGGNIHQSPEETALAYMNNLAYALGQKALWQRSYYVGAFGEYDMAFVRYHDHFAGPERGGSCAR